MSAFVMYLHAAQAACCYVIYYTSIAEKVENILDESSKETIEDITCDTKIFINPKARENN